MNTISKKKFFFPIRDELRGYLTEYSREVKLPIQYKDLLHFESSMPVYDKEGRDTLWETVMFSQSDMEEINENLTKIYSLLKTEGDLEVTEHLYTNRIDYCPFGFIVFAF